MNRTESDQARHEHQDKHDPFTRRVPGCPLCATWEHPAAAAQPGGTLPLPPEGHAAEASRLLCVADDLMQDTKTPAPGLLELAVLALAHAITALAADEFRDEGGSAGTAGSVLFPPGWDGQDASGLPATLRNRILAAMRDCPGGETAEALAILLTMPAPVITGELGQMAKDGLTWSSGGVWLLTAAGARESGPEGGSAPGRGELPTPATPLREAITFWLSGPGTPPARWSARDLAGQTGRPAYAVRAELREMEGLGLARQYGSGRKITWTLA
jgi:hypothetical protein